MEENFKAVKYDQEVERVNYQTKQRLEKEKALAEEKERLKMFKPLVQDPKTNHIPTPPTKQIKPKSLHVHGANNMGKAPAGHHVHHVNQPHRPQDIYKLVWNRKDTQEL